MTDIADKASEREQQLNSDAMQAHRARVQAAETPRLKDGHRVCLDCDDPIDPRRLAANPAAVRCTECQLFHE